MAKIIVLYNVCTYVSKKSPTGPTERTPKPEYLIALQLTERGPLVRFDSIFDGMYVAGGFNHFYFYPYMVEMIRFTLPETNSRFAPENGWLEYDRFLLGQTAYFHGLWEGNIIHPRRLT